jgi:hypothetical protein
MNRFSVVTLQKADLRRFILRKLMPALLLLPTLAAAGGSAPRDLDWLDMMPPDEVKVLERMADSIDHGGLGSAMSFGSERTVPKMNGARGKLLGYVVPITVNGKREVVDMFLVPYFGACLHMPPPPPNQIVYIKPKTPVKLGAPWDAYYAIGTLRVNKLSNEMATAVYAFDLEKLEVLRE